MVHPNTRWPLEWVEMLKDLYPRGYSAGTIATHINAKFRDAQLSRNAVIGKIDRMGLERDEYAVREARRRGGGLKPNTPWRAKPKSTWTPKDITPAAPPPPKPPIPVVHVSAIKERTFIVSDKRSLTGAIIPGPSPIPPRQLPAPPPVPDPASTEPITIDQLTARSCRWPMWSDDPGDARDRVYCGKPRDPKSRLSCYCAEHFAKSVSRVSRRAA